MTIVEEKFLKGYLTAALWSSNDESDDSGGQPLDKNYNIEDFSYSALEKANKECKAFMAANASDLADLPPEQAGHDFWLTRNRHGTGFGDRGYGEKGERLTKAAHDFGSVDLFVAADGLIY